MPTTGTKQLQKITKLSSGKIVLNDTVLVLEDILKAVKSGNLQDLKKLPVRITLALEGISLVTNLLDDALRLDGNYKLSTELRSAEIAQEKREEIRNNRFQQSSTKKTRKPKHELRLQTAVHTPKKSKSKSTGSPAVISPPNKKARLTRSNKEADRLSR